MRGHPRSNAAAKDSEWVRERQALESSMPSDVNEIILVGDGANRVLCWRLCLHNGVHIVRHDCGQHGGMQNYHCECVTGCSFRLRHADGAVMEGLTSNVFAVVDDAIVTAGDGVLMGTVRRLILNVCQANGIPVREAPPNLDDVASWQGCIVSSTSRLSLPVAEIQVCNDRGDVQQVHRLRTDGIVGRLDDLVLAAVEDTSEPL
jgi:Amino-transferase class IV